MGLAILAAVQHINAQVTRSAVPWINQTVPKPDSDGWIVLFDGEHLSGCDPTNECFKSGKIFLQAGALWVDSTTFSFQLKGHEAALRVQAKKVSGRDFHVNFGRDTGEFYGGDSFAIGRFTDHFERLQTGKSPAGFDDFFEMEFLVTGGKLMLVANNKTVAVALDEESKDAQGIAVGAFKSISVFKRIEVKLSDVRSLFPKDEAASGAQPKSDLSERLKKLQSLYDQGLINKDDYDKKKKEIMDSL